MSLLDDRARPKHRRPFDERPDPFGRLPEFLPPDDRPEIDDPFDLSEPVGLEGRNRRDDVARIESLLGRAGYLDLDATDGATGFFGQRLDQAIRKFQKDRGLTVDGAILPGGETIGALADFVAEQPPLRSPPDAAPNRARLGRVFAMMRPPVPPSSDRATPANAAVPLLLGAAPLAGVTIELMRRQIERGQKQRGADPGTSERTVPAEPPPPNPGFPSEPPKLPDPRDPPPEPVEIPTINGTPVPELLRTELMIFQALSEEIRKQLTEALKSDPGDEFTIFGHNLILEKLLPKSLAKRGVDKERFRHIRGVSKPEEFLPNAETKGKKGSSYPDMTLEDIETKKKVRINTGKTKKIDRKPIASEQRQMEKLVKNMIDDGLALFLPKFRPGMDVEAYSKDVENRLDEFFTRYFGPPK